MHPQRDSTRPAGAGTTGKAQGRKSILRATLAGVLLWTHGGDGLAGQESPIRPVRLRCEYRFCPEGLDTRRPRLSWELVSRRPGSSQSSYRILVASDLDRLRPGHCDLWDSGTVASGQSAQIVYDGVPLRSRARCYWRVRIRDRDGRLSAWSAPTYWTLGLLRTEDWKARWIGAPGPWPRRARTRLGFRSRLADREGVAHHVILDLGAVEAFDAVRLHRADP